MSATTGPSEAQLAAASYDRMLAETRKFVAEQNKLADEAMKLRSEGLKFNRERWIIPLTAAVTVFGGILAAVIARLPEILHAFGVGH